MRDKLIQADMLNKRMNGASIVSQVPRGQSISFAEIMPEVTERVTCGEYHYRKMARDMQMAMNASDIEENM